MFDMVSFIFKGFTNVTKLNHPFSIDTNFFLFNLLFDLPFGCLENTFLVDVCISLFKPDIKEISVRRKQTKINSCWKHFWIFDRTVTLIVRHHTIENRKNCLNFIFTTKFLEICPFWVILAETSFFPWKKEILCRYL